jgi:hypothetical protein
MSESLAADGVVRAARSDENLKVDQLALCRLVDQRDWAVGLGQSARTSGVAAPGTANEADTADEQCDTQE